MGQAKQLSGQPVYSTAEIRAIEQAAFNNGLADHALMLRAGRALLLTLQQYWSGANDIVVVCGKGNNGGDGYVFARLAFESGFHVRVMQVVDYSSLSGISKQAAIDCVDAGVPLQSFDKEQLKDADLIVDALLGIGISGEVTGDYAYAIQAINTTDAMVMSVDIPSGINADTAAVHGVAVNADVTVTFIGPKCGLFTGKGRAHAGRVICNTLGVNEKQQASATLLTSQTVQYPARSNDAHKGNCGHVLIVGGNRGMAGAACLAAQAALRAGAGLVSVATHQDSISVITKAQPEVMCHAVSHVEDLSPLIQKADVTVLGPGLGEDEWAQTIFSHVIHSEKPLLIDADGLNQLAKYPMKKNHWVLTPHPAEAARLLNKNNDAVLADRFSGALSLQEKYGGTIVLKGAGTLIADDMMSICSAGNPGMATAGMGDSLSGIIAAFIAQEMSPQQAARSGVFCHATAADLAVRESGEVGLVASDLFPVLRRVINRKSYHAGK